MISIRRQYESGRAAICLRDYPEIYTRSEPVGQKLGLHKILLNQVVPPEPLVIAERIKQKPMLPPEFDELGFGYRMTRLLQTGPSSCNEISPGRFSVNCAAVTVSIAGAVMGAPT